MKYFTLLFFAVATLFINGCGYHVGSIAHPQLESVAVAEAQNETVEPRLSYFIRQHLAEEVQTDGSLELLSKSQADCIIYPRIISTYLGGVSAASTNNDITFVTRTYSVRVNVEYSIIIPGKMTPIKTGRVTGTAYYQVVWDPEVSKQEAFNAACKDAAQRIVKNLTEGW